MVNSRCAHEPFPTLFSFVALTALLGGSSCNYDPVTEEVLEPGDPGLVSEPRWLTFTCVEPGCSTTLTTEVRVEGSRSIAVKRIVLSDEARTDFRVAADKTAPFILAPGETFDVEVTFTPTGDPRVEDIDLKITYTDASTTDPEVLRIPPGELVIPLVRRVVGEPQLEVRPAQVVFGPVAIGARTTRPLTIRNIGFGNVGLVIASATSDNPAVTIENLPDDALLPNETWDLQAVYQPTESALSQGFITIRSAGQTDMPLRVPFIGTSIPTPKAIIEPANGIDFGEIAVGTSTQAILTLTNGGSTELRVGGLRFEPATSSVTLTLDGPGIGRTARVDPLDSFDVPVAIDARSRGPVETEIVVETTDPDLPLGRIAVRALVTKPEIQVEPSPLDFGPVPRGWTVVRPVELRNAGFGPLVIRDVELVLGSSELFTLRERPNFPVTLRHDQRIVLEVEFRAEAEASFGATLAIDSNDTDRPSVELTVAAEGSTCERGCPIANGTPSCTSGMCAVASCNERWFDADRDAGNGCECAEVGNDPGEFCAGSVYLAQLNDDGARATFLGVVPEEGDVDLLRFFAYDESGFFTDAYDVRVRLDSDDPSLRLCVYRHDTDRRLSECFFENESCPVDRQFRREGSFGRDDSADYIVRVFREPNEAPTCTPYTLTVSNAE